MYSTPHRGPGHDAADDGGSLTLSLTEHTYTRTRYSSSSPSLLLLLLLWLLMLHNQFWSLRHTVLAGLSFFFLSFPRDHRIVIVVVAWLGSLFVAWPPSRLLYYSGC